MVDRVLLTGAGGFVGSHMLRHLLVNTDFHIVCPVTFRNRGKSARISSAFNDHPEWINRVDVILHDLSTPIDNVTAAQFGDIKYILNIASDSHVDRSIATPVPFVQNNVNLMLSLLEYARTLPNLKMFLQMSTDEIYGPMLKFPAREWDAILPSNPYSASKAAQEAIAISYWRTYDVPLIITNTMNLFGEMQDSEKYFAKVMRAIQRDEIVIVHADTRTNIIGSRFYIHARNFADAWLTIMQYNCTARYPYNNEPMRFNIVGEREINNLELAQMIADHMGKELRYGLDDFHSSRPGHDLKYGLDGTRMLSLYGWTPPYSFEETVHNTVQWTLKHPEWL
jgi:dTDP-glucose 4,6-dehydratase